jgi:DNA-3-methyladenine glycosylase I
MNQLSTCKRRCEWVNDDPLYIDYHDNEWGVPVFDERLLFEFLILEGMQAGLSWLTVLKKRDNYRACFDNFDAQKVAQYDKRKVDTLLSNSGIIRSRLKIEAIVVNAKAFLQTKEECGSFSEYIWDFVEGKPIKNCWNNIKQIPTNSSISDKLSKDLKNRGFKFVGSTICYAFMQAVGMVQDHLTHCFRYEEIKSSI